MFASCAVPDGTSEQGISHTKGKIFSLWNAWRRCGFHTVRDAAPAAKEQYIDKVFVKWSCGLEPFGPGLRISRFAIPAGNKGRVCDAINGQIKSDDSYLIGKSLCEN